LVGRKTIAMRDYWTEVQHLYYVKMNACTWYCLVLNVQRFCKKAWRSSRYSEYDTPGATDELWFDPLHVKAFFLIHIAQTGHRAHPTAYSNNPQGPWRRDQNWVKLYLQSHIRHHDKEFFLLQNYVRVDSIRCILLDVERMFKRYIEGKGKDHVVPMQSIFT